MAYFPSRCLSRHCRVSQLRSGNHLAPLLTGTTNAARSTFPQLSSRTSAWSCMPKPTPRPEPDPMARVVDRLLAQLPGLHGSAEPPSPSRTSVGGIRIVSVPRQSELPSEAGLWGRTALAVALGVMMTAYPYFRDCGLPLFGYLFAVAAVVFAGGWVAVLSWQLRNEITHVLSLLLILWGLALTSDVLLPRTGYAAVPATWACGEPGSGPAWMRWFAGPSTE